MKRMDPEIRDPVVSELAWDGRVEDADIASDVDIAAAVRSALDWDAFIPGTRIQSSVTDGQVSLKGEVKHCAARDDAEKAVLKIPGVRRVLNEIRVKPAAAEPKDIRKSIEVALERRALREARRIELEIHEGRVILSGAVHSWAERQSVVGAAKNTPGVCSVDDRLQIDGSLHATPAPARSCTS